MPKFLIWQSSRYGSVSVTQYSEYALTEFEYILDSKYARILNMAGL